MNADPVNAAGNPDDDDDKGDWFVFGRNSDDGMAYIRVREDLHNEFHPDEYDHRVICSLAIESPDGLPTDEEADELLNLEEDIERVFGDDGVLVGAITANSQRHLFFYATEDFDVALLEPHVGAAIDRKTDPEWADYDEWLTPSESERQVSSDLELLAALQENGDDLSKLRRVDHYFCFDEEADRDAAAKELERQGQKKLDLSHDPDEDAPFGIHIVVRHPMAPPAIFEITLAMLTIAIENNGFYDGWESPVVKSKATK